VADSERFRALELLDMLERLHPGSEFGLAAFDRERLLFHWSAGIERLIGLAADQALGRTADEVFPSIDPSLLHGPHGRIHQWTDRGRECTCTPLVLDGAICGGVVLVRDVSSDRLAELRMQETENRFRNMADASPVLLWMSGPDALCTFFNQSWLGFTGRELADELNVGWAEGVYFEDFQQCIDTYLDAFNRRGPFEMEYRLRRYDGEYRWVFDQGVPRWLPDGTFAGYIGSCVDITERKQLEAELLQAVRAREEFLSIGAHELRTPLTPMRLIVQSLLHDGYQGTLTPQLRSNLQTLERLIERQSRLTDNLLQVSRICMDPIPVTSREADLVSVVRSVVALFEEEARRNESPVSIIEYGAIVGLWDPEKIERVVGNLMANGIKYGAGKPIDVRVEHAHTLARIIVRDHGIGIDRNDQKRIFERFERSVSVQNYGGFGIGLWIARRLTEAMGGAIRCDSELGKGSTFVVELPIQHARCEENADA